uniref:Uncharacterized protein n=1 Tax=Arundo donax TaxID=35708 RepID=A0A0A9E2K4_ARUDO
MEFISFVPLSSLVAWWPQLVVACSPGRRLAGRYVTPFDAKPRHPRICVAHACPGPLPCRLRGPPTVHLLRPLRSSTSPDLSPSSSPRAPPSAPTVPSRPDRAALLGLRLELLHLAAFPTSRLRSSP